MSWKIRIVFFFLLSIFACGEKEDKKETSLQEEIVEYHSYDHLIDVAELKQIQKEGAIKIIDFRKPTEYHAGHIPEALNIWRTDIEDINYPFKGMAASKEALEKLFSALGIRLNDTIVIYDDRGLCDAARLWWVLKNFNFNTVKLLNGGWRDWKIMQGEVSSKTSEIIPSKFTFESDVTNTYLVYKEELEVQMKKKEMVLIDTRTADEFSGKRQKSGAKRAGKIPGSYHIDWEKAMDMKRHKFKPRVQLEKIFSQLGAAKDKTIVTYCHTGVRSAHTIFVLTQLLGYTNVKNYDGSWSEWSYFERSPIEQDSITTVFN